MRPYPRPVTCRLLTEKGASRGLIEALRPLIGDGPLPLTRRWARRYAMAFDWSEVAALVMAHPGPRRLAFLRAYAPAVAVYDRDYGAAAVAFMRVSAPAKRTYLRLSAAATPGALVRAVRKYHAACRPAGRVFERAAARIVRAVREARALALADALRGGAA